MDIQQVIITLGLGFGVGMIIVGLAGMLTHTNCPYCKKSIPNSATVCSYCGRGTVK